MTETGYAQMIEPTEPTRLGEAANPHSRHSDARVTRGRYAPPTAGNPASDLALREALKPLVQRLAAGVGRKAGETLARLDEDRRRVALSERLRTDRKFASRFRTAVVRHAARQGVSEITATPFVFDAFLKES